MSNEYIIWGKNDDNQNEQILYTKAQSYNQAKEIIKILEKDFNCFDCRIQVIDFKTKIDFTKTINIC